ncbi:hypothetical protein P3L10_003493 [Capsicum annuum]|uniref:uncharacterized protein LOC107848195 n=1 Tax=Capsicum annuum TaxID=4072 RepID=UPI0007BFBDEF|nr:uncharacterized protein LOC107848195 [Capsicum annuum]
MNQAEDKERIYDLWRHSVILRIDSKKRILSLMDETMMDRSSETRIPPEPPDKGSSHDSTDNPIPTTYSEILMAQSITVTSFPMALQEDPPLVESSELGDTIPLTAEDKERIYGPWRHSVVVKVLGKRFNHHYLRKKLADLWKINDPFRLIDLGKDFYTANFNREDLQRKVLQQGPWFVAGAYLSVRSWVHNFVPSDSKVLTMAIWVRLPELPTEF